MWNNFLKKYINKQTKKVYKNWNQMKVKTKQEIPADIELVGG